jgi:Domain of unknown function (DUF3846)
VITILYVPMYDPAQTREIEPTLDILQGLVGGNIQVISGQDWSAYLNEEGKVDGLPVNPLATLLASGLGWTWLPGDILVGPVVFCGPVDDDGAVTSVTARVLELARKETGDVG